MRVFHGNAACIACRVRLHTWPSVNVLQGRIYHRLMRRKSTMRKIRKAFVDKAIKVLMCDYFHCRKVLFRIIWPFCARSNGPHFKRKCTNFSEKLKFHHKRCLNKTMGFVTCKGKMFIDVLGKTLPLHRNESLTLRIEACRRCHAAEKTRTTWWWRETQRCDAALARNSFQIMSKSIFCKAEKTIGFLC